MNKIKVNKLYNSGKLGSWSARSSFSWLDIKNNIPLLTFSSLWLRKYDFKTGHDCKSLSIAW